MACHINAPMAPTVDTIRGTFSDAPHISESPTYEELRELELQVQRNAYKCKTTNGGGKHGCLGLVMSTVDYSQATPGNQAWTHATNPGTKPTITAGTTAAVERELERQFAVDHYRYHYEFNVNQALKLYIEQAVGMANLQGILDLISGLDDVAIPKIFQHLFERPSARVTPAEVYHRPHKLDTQGYNFDKTMEALFLRMAEFQRFARHGGDPLSDLNLCNMVLQYIHKTGHYNKACDDWWLMTTAQHTWANIKKHFTTSEVVVRRNAATNQQAGFQTANLIQAMRTENQQAMDRLQLEMRHDLQDATQQFQQALQAHIPTPTGTENCPPNDQEQALQTHTGATTKLHQEFELLKLQLAKQDLELQRARGNGGPKNPIKKVFKNNNYCWTHGFNIADAHTSATCKKPATGHQTDATRADPKGGTMKGKSTVGL